MRGCMALLLALAFPVNAQIYEWYDEDGQRHFSDRKPVGVEYRIVGGGESRLSTYAPQTNAMRSGAARTRAASAHREARDGSSTPPAPDRGERLCVEYLERLDAIQDALRTGYSEPSGNRLRAQRSALQQAYRRECT